MFWFRSSETLFSLHWVGDAMPIIISTRVCVNRAAVKGRQCQHSPRTSQFALTFYSKILLKRVIRNLSFSIYWYFLISVLITDIGGFIPQIYRVINRYGSCDSLGNSIENRSVCLTISERIPLCQTLEITATSLLHATYTLPRLCCSSITYGRQSTTGAVRAP